MCKLRNKAETELHSHSNPVSWSPLHSHFNQHLPSGEFPISDPYSWCGKTRTSGDAKGNLSIFHFWFVLLFPIDGESFTGAFTVYLFKNWTIYGIHVWEVLKSLCSKYQPILQSIYETLYGFWREILGMEVFWDHIILNI